MPERTIDSLIHEIDVRASSNIRAKRMGCLTLGRAYMAQLEKLAEHSPSIREERSLMELINREIDFDDFAAQFEGRIIKSQEVNPDIINKAIKPLLLTYEHTGLNLSEKMPSVPQDE
jgi:hypothetical protein